MPGEIVERIWRREKPIGNSASKLKFHEIPPDRTNRNGPYIGNRRRNIEKLISIHPDIDDVVRRTVFETFKTVCIVEEISLARNDIASLIRLYGITRCRWSSNIKLFFDLEIISPLSTLAVLDFPSIRLIVIIARSNYPLWQLSVTRESFHHTRYSIPLVS